MISTLPTYREVPPALLHLDSRTLIRCTRDAETTDPLVQYVLDALRYQTDSPGPDYPYGIVLGAVAQEVYDSHVMSRRRATSKARALIAHVLAIPDGPLTVLGRLARLGTPTEMPWRP